MSSGSVSGLVERTGLVTLGCSTACSFCTDSGCVREVVALGCTQQQRAAGVRSQKARAVIQVKLHVVAYRTVYGCAAHHRQYNPSRDATEHIAPCVL
jgi:hypothetical protein